MNASDLLREKWFPPPEFTGSFEGKTVLITGANTGIGFEAAKKVAALGARRLIITTRSHSKGEAAKQQIQKWLLTTGTTSQTEISPMVLDMSTSDGVNTFVQQLSLTTKTVDAVILNAGMLTPKCNITPDGFEETFQVNTVGTTFLATLLLPMLISTSDSTNSQTHLTFLSSRAAISQALPSDDIRSSTTPIRSLSEVTAFPKGPAGSQARYAQSKLFLEYAIRHLNQLPLVQNNEGTPKVIINSVCPGACKTNITHNLDTISLMSFMLAMSGPLILKPPVRGADACLTALTAGEESRSRMWIVRYYAEEWDSLKSTDGKAFGRRVWEELKAAMIGWEPSIKGILQEH